LSAILKPLLALLISILLFAGFTWLADTELLEYVQTSFYDPSILKSYNMDNIIDAEIVEKHIDDLQERFAAMLTDFSVRSSFLYNQSVDDIYERSRLFGILLETTSGLQSVRFIDSNGVRIHFSTLPGDIISQSRSSTAYRNYNEDSIALPYETVSVPSDGKMKFTMDEQTERIIFSFPFFDSMDVYRGTALFTISVRALANKLVEEGRLKYNEDVSVTSAPAGILLGSPVSSKKDILEKTAAIWNSGLLERVIIDAEDSGVKFSLISLKTNRELFFGHLVNDNIFSIPESMQFLFKLAAFITIFLSLFFLLNMKPNAVTLVKTRIKRLRDSLFEHLYINKTVKERAKWVLELEQRRNGIRAELKRGLKLSPRLEKNIDDLINKSWDELLSVLKSGSIQYLPTDISQIDLKSSEIAEQEAEPPEEVEELEEAEAPEEIEELEEAEALEETEELEEIEALEEIEELEEAEAPEEAEELEEIEALEEVEEAEAESSWKGLEVIDEKFHDETEEDIYKSIDEAWPQPDLLAEWEDIDEFEAILERAMSADTVKHEGLLKLAEDFTSKRNMNQEQHERIKGLLARAEEKENLRRAEYRGLLAAASDYEDTDQKQPDTFSEIDVVSPFSSMFASLKKDEETDGKSK